MNQSQKWRRMLAIFLVMAQLFCLVPGALAENEPILIVEGEGEEAGEVAFGEDADDGESGGLVEMGDEIGDTGLTLEEGDEDADGVGTVLDPETGLVLVDSDDPEETYGVDSAAGVETDELYLAPTEEVYYPEGGLSNDDAAAGYINRQMGIGSSGSPRKRAANIGGRFGESPEGRLYNALKAEITEIAAGERESTVIEVPAKEIYESDLAATAEDLNVESLIENNTFSADAVAAFKERIGVNVEKVLDALLADCPYEMYWYDKTQGFSSLLVGMTYNGTYLRIANYDTAVCTFRFCVAAEYSADGNIGTYSVDTTKGQAVSAAVETANSIITNNSSLSDIQKLNAYKNAICNLVDYNDDAAGGGMNYGNPWQLVWVFDGDEETKVVCEGYSKAFQYLCDHSSFTDNTLTAISVSGTMVVGNDGGPHMWNIVTMNGGCYLADVTNCDSGSVGYPDKLFLKGYTTHENNQYNFTFGNTTVRYAYDDETVGLYLDSDIALSSEGSTNAAVMYLDENGEEQTCTEYTVLDSSVTTLTEGWYVAEGNVSCSVASAGEAKIILCDNSNVSFRQTSGAAGIVIYAQSDGDQTGCLTNRANDQYECAFSGPLTVNGGNILVISQYIGISGNYTINRGSVSITVTTNNGGGILALGDVNINGGTTTIENTSSNYGNFLISGIQASSGTVNISGADTVVELKSNPQKIRAGRINITRGTISFEMGENGNNKNSLETVDNDILIRDANLSTNGAIEANGNIVLDWTPAGKRNCRIQANSFKATGTVSQSHPFIASTDSDGNTVYTPSNENEHNITIASGILNGTISSSYDSADEGETVTLTATPADGYKLDSITVTDEDGGNVTVTNNTFTMPAKAVTVTATFVDISHAWGMPTYEWAENNSTVTARRVCSRCNNSETETVNTTSVVTTAATCEGKGVTTYTATFTKEGFTTQTKELDNVSALGHAWGTPTYVWADDNSTVTATRVCANDASHPQTETVNTTSAVTTPATCEDKGKTTYTATFTNDAFEQQTKEVEDIPALGHSWNAPTYTWSSDNRTVTAKRTCKTNASHVETETVDTTSEVTTPATCTAMGKTTYTSAQFTNTTFEQQTKVVENIPKEEHTWSDWTVTTPETCTTAGSKTRTCSVCKGTETQAISATGHKRTTVKGYAATCTETGLKDGVKCSVCNNWITPQQTIPALGHSWNAPTYTWSSDNRTVTAKRTCKRNASHVETETVSVTSRQTRAASCTQNSITTYTSASFKNGAFKVQTKSIENSDKKGHTRQTVKGRAATCTATGLTDGVKCSVCNTWITPQQTIAKKSHTRQTVRGYAATYTSTGLTDGVKCSVCGTWITPQQTIPMLQYPGYELNKVKNNGTLTINKDEKVRLVPNFAVGATVTGYKSAKDKVASVDGSGLVTANAEGKAKITVTTSDKKKKATITINVVDPYKPMGIAIAQGKAVTLSMGQALQLNAALAPSSARATLTWKSSKPKVAVVDGNGMVIPQGEGTAKITVTTHNKKKATITIKVVDPNKPLGIAFAQGKTVTLKVGQTLQLGAVMNPATAQSALTWKSAKAAVASVDGNGIVTAHKKGKAKITVTTYNKKKATITVNVVE